MNSKFFYILLLIASCFVSAVSQVLLKKAAQKEYTSFVRQYLNVLVVLAYFLFFAVVFANIYILRFIPMTVMTPIAETLPYVLSIVFGCIFFDEKITVKRIIGSIIIILGIIIVVL